MKQAGIHIAKPSRFKALYFSTSDLRPANRSLSTDFKTSLSQIRHHNTVSSKTLPLTEFFVQSNDPVIDIDSFAQQDEFTLLRSLVNRQLTTKFDDSLASLRQKREHQKLLSNAISHSAKNIGFSFAFGAASKSKHMRAKAQSTDILEKTQQFISTPTRTPDKQEIINFITIHAGNTPKLKQVQTILETMAEYSNQYTLPAVFKAFYTILNDHKTWPSFSPAKINFLIEALLNRALQVFPETEYIVEDDSVLEVVGSNQLDSIFDIISCTEEPKIKDHYLRLVSRSGSFKDAEKLIVESINNGIAISDESVDTFFKSLGNYLAINRKISPLGRLDYNVSVKKAINKYKTCLKSQNLTPAVATFLLEHTSFLEEFYRLLNAIEESRYRDHILSKCQPSIIETAVRCSLPTSLWNQLDREGGNISTHNIQEKTELLVDYGAPVVRTSDIIVKSMATMFGILNRFAKSSAGITVEALDQCIVTSARLGNSSGMYKALSLRLQGINPSTMKSQTLVDVFSSFPLNKKPLNREKLASPYLWVVNDAIIADSARDEIILLHLRNHFEPEKNTRVYHHYISALGRCHRIDLLLHEWDTVISPLVIDEGYLENPHFQDIFMSLLAAFKMSNSPENGLNILNSLLNTSTVSESSHGFALNILCKVLSHELLPLPTSLNHVTRWLINNNNAPFWSNADVVRLFSEISASASVPDVTSMQSNNNNKPSKGETPSIIGKLLSELVIQVRQGDDIELALKHLEHTFGGN